MRYIQHLETILYVSDQQISTNFYQKLLKKHPDINVPGMTEFRLSAASTLGLMPNKSIEKILLDYTPTPSSGNGIPRCELYFYVDNIEIAYENALKIGAKLISPISDRDWGDSTCYFADPDGHIVAFAKKKPTLNTK